VTEASPSDPFRASLGFGLLPGCLGHCLVRNPWKEPAQVSLRSTSWCCQCVDDMGTDAWDVEAAPYSLLEPEWRVWRHLPHASARRQWMRGCVAAKDAVRLLLLDRYNIMAPLETIGILPDPQGRPQVTCSALPKTSASLSVSISHCGNSSVAIATEQTEAGGGVGIDVASLIDNHEGLAEGGFCPAEISLLEECPEPDRPHWLLRLWCAKEAVSKALGVGLKGNPMNYRVLRIDRPGGTVEIQTADSFELTDPSRSRRRVTAHVGCDRGLAFAVAWVE
jgi:phosphopantetheine--protein transferase-like protein